MELNQLIRLAYSAERAAAFAYQGHAGSVSNVTEKEEIKKIENQEWEHRSNLLRFMSKLSIKPSIWYEMKFYIIGKVICFSCYVIGWFMPMYFAGRLESNNVNEYILMGELANNTKINDELQCIEQMAIVEKQHEMYFLNKVANHKALPLFQKVFSWGVGYSYNKMSTKEVNSLE